MLHVGFPCLGVLKGVVRVLAFPRTFRFNPSSSKGIINDSAKCSAILPRPGMSSHARVKTYQLRQLR